MTSAWYTLQDLADLRLPGLPHTRFGLHRLAGKRRWTRAEWEFPANPNGMWRRRRGLGGGIEVRACVLPDAARRRLERSSPDAPAAHAVPAHDEQPASQLWAAFQTLTEDRQAEARRRLGVIEDIESLIDAGASVGEAVAVIARRSSVAVSTVYAWRALVAHCRPGDRLPLLADSRGVKREKTGCDPEAWECFKADYLRLERPTLASCYRRLERIAADQDWTIPSARTLERRLRADVSEAVIVLSRQGAKALERLYPPQSRDRTGLHALEAVNADGHVWDVWVKWPDGEIARPCMVAFQDIFSAKMLSWRLDKSENKEAVRLAFGDLVERYGVPDHCTLDNGRAFASKWLTGGTPTRYRFKIRDEDPIGLFGALGVQVHWATPYRGQAKPIERAFRDFCDDIAKHPALAGAWTGNAPHLKPENYRSRAVPYDIFAATVADGIAAHNARTGRRSAVCAGRSLNEAFEASYATALVRKASAEQRRLWLLAAEGVRARAENGSIHLLGNRFWSEWLVGHRGDRLVVRFDPQNITEIIHVYGLDGRYLGQAECVEAAGFADVNAAREHAQARRQFIKATRQAAAAEKRLSIADVAGLLPALDGDEGQAQVKLVRPLFAHGPAGRAAEGRNTAGYDQEHDEVMENFARGVERLRAQRGS